MANPPRFVWDVEIGRYRYAASGRLVPLKSIRDAIDFALNNQRLRNRGLSEQVRRGTLSVEEFEIAMRQGIKSSQLYATAAAKGGWDNLTAADYGRIGGHVAREYSFLQRFTDAIASGEQRRDGRLIDRAETYAEAARRTFHQADAEIRQEQGADLVRNILNPADHCGECLDLAAAGPMPVDEMPMPGERECGNNCKCDLEYSSSETASVTGEAS